MTKSEKVESCMKQAQFAYNMHNNRRQYEWKITIGLWAIILTTIIKEIHLCPFIWILIVLGYAFLWLKPVWVANENNKNWYDHFMWQAVNLLIDDNFQIEEPPPKITGWHLYYKFLNPKRSGWAMFFQFIVTIFLIYITYKFY